MLFGRHLPRNAVNHNPIITESMPVIIDTAMPAAETLRREGLTVSDIHSAMTHRRIALVNLMPVKPDTELDFLRLIAPCHGNTAVTFVNMRSHQCRHTSPEHIQQFYICADQLDLTDIDGAIITGAPLEFVEFENVTYWREITNLMDRLRQHNIPVLNICWAAYASLYHTYGIKMRLLNRKISGVFTHSIIHPECPLMRGVNDGFTIPHSRFATWDIEDITRQPDLDIVASSQEAGIYMLASNRYREHYVVGHGEYDRMTLDNEYRRDQSKGMSPNVPSHYYPGNDPQQIPAWTWRDTALTIMANWIDTLGFHQ